MTIRRSPRRIDRQVGPTAEAALLDSVASGDLAVEDMGGPDWVRVAELVRI